MKKVIIAVLGALIIISGILFVCYPFISNYFMSQNQSSEIASQQAASDNLDEEALNEAFKAAEAYNKNLLGNVTLTDPFDPGLEAEEDEEYENILNINGDSLMASIEIPRIDVNLPVYHGTDESTLLKGVGHLQKTSLPVGGESTHAVLTGHTGLTSARLFTDLNQLENGDVFYIKVLNRTLAYKVDKIQVVEPTQTDALEIVPGEDYVTLVTCTPYGVNSHRLLVRGTRISLEEAEEILKNTSSVESTWMEEYKKALIAGVMIFAAIIICFFVIRTVCKKVKKRKSKI